MPETEEISSVGPIDCSYVTDVSALLHMAYTYKAVSSLHFRSVCCRPILRPAGGGGVFKPHRNSSLKMELVSACRCPVRQLQMTRGCDALITDTSIILTAFRTSATTGTRPERFATLMTDIQAQDGTSRP